MRNRLPQDLKSCTTRLLWGLYDPLGGPKGNGGWLKPHEVKLLGDGGLAVAPPSRHVKTGVEYQGVGKYQPGVFPLPAEAPQWLIDAPALTLPVKQLRPAREDVPEAPMRRRTSPDGKIGPDRDEMIAAIPPAEKIRLAASWGLRFARNADLRRAWVNCHAIGRKDRTPSAGFDPKTGVYHDFGSATKLSFFDLAVALGAYPSWLDALKAVAAGLSLT